MDYELDDDPTRIQPDVVWAYLSTDAYWGRWRTREDVDAQLASAWRVVGVYVAGTGEQVGFARAARTASGSPTSPTCSSCPTIAATSSASVSCGA